jgi:2-polyprenyl-3-methyl-5-hydroxy-6-metoxy-1,4-benzoquinol methylase
MSRTFSYAAPLNVERTEDCFFYHKIDLTGVGEVGGDSGGWDLRASIDDYLGRFDFRGKRVIDMGAASGFLTFEMEKRGAEVVSFDMIDGSQWDIVPRYDMQGELDGYRARCAASHARLKNAYWFSHKRLGSKARAYYGDIYDLPGELGAFDVAMFGMILAHLRDPFQAIYSASRLVKDTIIITNQMMDTMQPIGSFIPSRENREWKAWWGLSRGCLSQMLEVLGFSVKSSTTCSPQCVREGRVRTEECVSLVAKRVAGSIYLTGSTKAPNLAA